MKTGCDTCDTHGPNLPTVLNEGALLLHRALHGLGRALLHPYARILRRATTLTKRGN